MAICRYTGYNWGMTNDEEVRKRLSFEYMRDHGDFRTREDYLAGWDAALDLAEPCKAHVVSEGGTVCLRCGQDDPLEGRQPHVVYAHVRVLRNKLNRERDENRELRIELAKSRELLDAYHRRFQAGEKTIAAVNDWFDDLGDTPVPNGQALAGILHAHG